MKSLQTRLWQFMALPVWQCAHAERLPYAPEPVPVVADVRLVIGQGHQLPATLLNDLLIALEGVQPDIQEETAWLAAGCPDARIVLGFNLTEPAGQLNWQGSLPLSALQKRELWSCLCSLNTGH
ncbi:hypothetical protein [Oceanimonas sp. CAM02]|uniref:hypothetical protein n=1 Tax=Oceanimonas sp. CAM02 TaxID=3080336 RepID=UPI0029357402|nr:hypothetical protein [Oceanimonas sp. CAM02]MDV2859004.1 hypothetical protein [Oceanimonas sp. CAM02]